MSKSATQNHFGLDSIRQSLKYFLFGKGSNAFLSLAILFALAALMEEIEYASFVSWQALILLIGMVSTLGIQAVMHRFLPELRADDSPLIYKLLSIGVSLRFLLALLIVGIIIANLPFIVALLKVPNHDNLLGVFLLIGALRLTGLSLSQACDALLWQRLTQIGLVSTNIFRIAAIFFMHYAFSLTLTHVVIIEFIAEAIFVLLLIWGARQNWLTESKESSQPAQSWWPENRQRVVRYGASKYIVSLTRILYGSAPNRLLAAQFSSNREIAILGFADSIVRLGRRFMPAILMVGFIRPVFIARYTTGSEFSSLVKMSNLIFRINLALLVVLMVGVLVVGEPMFNLLTNDKYGSAYLLVFGFLLLLVFEGLRQILELLIEVTELNQISILSNLVQSSSFLIAIPLFYFIGLWSIVVANIVGTVLACLICIIQLNRNNFKLFFEGRLVGLVLVQGLIIWAIAYFMLQWTGSIIIAACCVGISAICLAILFPPLEKAEIKQLRNLISAKKGTAKKSKT